MTSFENAPTIRGTTSITTCCKAMYTIAYTKVQINDDTHYESMSDIDVKQGCLLSPTLIGLYIDELKTYLDKIIGDSSCLFNIAVAIVLYDDNIVLLFISRASLQRLLNKLYKFCTSFSLEVNLSKTKIMIFGCNKIKLNQEAFYLDQDPIDITHEYKYIRIHFYSHGYFEPSNKRQGITSMKESEVKVTCWELKSHLFKALMLPSFMHGTEIWGGDLKNSH